MRLPQRIGSLQYLRSTQDQQVVHNEWQMAEMITIHCYILKRGSTRAALLLSRSSAVKTMAQNAVPKLERRKTLPRVSRGWEMRTVSCISSFTAYSVVTLLELCLLDIASCTGFAQHRFLRRFCATMLLRFFHVLLLDVLAREGLAVWHSLYQPGTRSILLCFSSILCTEHSSELADDVTHRTCPSGSDGAGLPGSGRTGAGLSCPA